MISLDYAALAISCGEFHFCVVLDKESSNLITWGKNENGQLGLGHRNHVDIPTLVPLEGRVVSATCLPHSTVLFTNLGEYSILGKQLMLADSLERKKSEDTFRVNEIEHVLVQLEHNLRHMESKRGVIGANVGNKTEDIKAVKEIIGTTGEVVKAYWKTVEDCDSELARLNVSSSSKNQLHQKSSDTKYMAIVGEKTIKDEFSRLSVLERELENVSETAKQLDKDIDHTLHVKLLLEMFKSQCHVGINNDLAGVQMEHFRTWLDSSTKILGRIKESTVENIALSYSSEGHSQSLVTAKRQENLLERSTFSSLLQESNSNLESLQSEVASSFEPIYEDERNSLYSKTGKEFSVYLKAVNREVIELRKEVNFYISHLMAYSKEQMEQLEQL